MKFTTVNLTRPSLEHFSGTPEGFTLNDANNICAKIKSLGQDELDKLLDTVIPKSRIFTPSSGVFDIQLHETMYKTFDAVIFPEIKKISQMSAVQLAQMYYNNNDSWPFISEINKKWYGSGIMPNHVDGIASTLRMRNLPMSVGQMATNVVGKQINGQSLRDAGWKVGQLSTLSEICRYSMVGGPGYNAAENFIKKWKEFNDFCQKIYLEFSKEYDRLDEVEPRTDAEILEDVEESTDGEKLYCFTIFGDGLDAFRWQYHAYLVGSRQDHSDMMYCDAAALLKFIDSRI